MDAAIVTGAAGLIGAEAVRFFAGQGLKVTGIDNDMRAAFFGPEASTAPVADRLNEAVAGYRHLNADVRDAKAIDAIFEAQGSNIKLIIHAAAQPSHDWAARDPRTDFDVNARGTLNVLEAARRYAPESVFIFTSTNKVYGDRPNRLPFIEEETRWSVDPSHPFAQGIDESMPIDDCLHSVFGASKVAADVMVQEYGRYFGMRTVCLRGGCLTGPGHAGAELHGFLAYLVASCAQDRVYRIQGYGGKQVRDNIHSYDLVQAMWHIYQQPRPGAVYNIGGGIESNVSVREAIAICESISGRPMRTEYDDTARTGDHKWWIGDLSRFKADYPDWRITQRIPEIIESIYAARVEHAKK